MSAYSTPVPSLVTLRYLSAVKNPGVPESPVKVTSLSGKFMSAYSIPVPSLVTFRYLSEVKNPGVPERPVKDVDPASMSLGHILCQLPPWAMYAAPPPA